MKLDIGVTIRFKHLHRGAELRQGYGLKAYAFNYSPKSRFLNFN